LSERAKFLVSYAERRLGRALTESEKDLVCAETSRRSVSELCAEFAQKKAKPSAPLKDKKIKPKVVKDEE